ncbi:MAG: hypothetical protein HFI92_07430 [Lachnospiraceae bacterium]|nr:hypothetical protein [Lachnospiraceae bacterium]
MKEKIIDFYNGIFTYCQPGLLLEPPRLLLEPAPGEMLTGSFVINSADERRIKGLLHTRIPGMVLKKDHFFARAARIEFTYEPVYLREGEQFTDRIWLETSAGEYELPVQIQIKGAAAEEEEEIPMPVQFLAEDLPPVSRMGNGRREEWRKKRRWEAAIAEIQRVVEQEKRNACTRQEATGRLRKLVEELKEIDTESPVCPLLDAWVMVLEERAEEAGWILRKYEKTRLLQLKESDTRALFLYVNSLCREDPETAAFSVTQLQKLYQKHPDSWMITAYLLELDPKLWEKSRTRYLMLERQFHNGTRNRLLYQEAWELLKEDMALFGRLGAFSLQVFGWAAVRGLLTPQTAQAAALQAVRIKRWSPLAVRLLKACYEVNPSKETAGAVCSVYIRGQRTDAEAFGWYEKGVEWDAKITNLYEYFIYALPEDYPKLLPPQVLLYFHYHNTLTSRQKTAFYCNLVRYGDPKDPVYEEHRHLLQDFLLEQLKERKVNPSLAWLYGRCLLADTLEEKLLEALADILFLQKLTCREKRIRLVEVSYEQLEEPIVVPLTGGEAYIPIYTPDVKITLLDEQGKRYRKTVDYELKRVMIEPVFLQLCARKLKDHLGLSLYLLDGKGPHAVREENLPLIWRFLEDRRIRESYRQKLQLELLDYQRRRRRLETLDRRLFFTDSEVLRMSRKDQGAYLEILILLGQDEDVWRLLERTGCREVDKRLLLRFLQRLMEDGAISTNLLRELAWLSFRQEMYTERVVALLAERAVGSTEELLALWKAGEQFGMTQPALEEQLLVQAMFTEQKIEEVFPVYRSMDDRGGDSVVGIAYLNYVSWLYFVKGLEGPEGLFDRLENHLLWEDPLSRTAVLAYLKQLSVLFLLSDAQKHLAGNLVGELPVQYRHFGFMKNLLSGLDEKEPGADYTVVEYRCDPAHKVVLHYVLEYHGKKSFDYLTECLYPVCQGVFLRRFILFYGERLTWFFTETKKNGEEISTECRTIENREEKIPGNSRFDRLCQMQRALDHHQERSLRRMMMEYEELTSLTEEGFAVRL